MGDTSKISIQELDQLKLVGIRVFCSEENATLEIPKASELLEGRKHEIRHVLNRNQQIGAFVVAPSSSEYDGYWVCMQVKEYDHVPEGMVSLTIPPQQYAVIRHKGSNKKIIHKYEILHSWVEKNNFKRKVNSWHLERFDQYEDIDNIEVDLMDTIG